MAKYRVDFQSRASLSVYVEADSKDEAAELAEAETPASWWASCSGYNSHGHWALDVSDWERTSVDAEEG